MTPNCSSPRFDVAEQFDHLGPSRGRRKSCVGPRAEDRHRQSVWLPDAVPERRLGDESKLTGGSSATSTSTTLPRGCVTSAGQPGPCGSPPVPTNRVACSTGSSTQYAASARTGSDHVRRRRRARPLRAHARSSLRPSRQPPSSDAHPLRYTHAAVLQTHGLACCAVERAGVCAARSGVPYRLGRCVLGAGCRLD